MVVKDICFKVWDNCYFSKEECSPEHCYDTGQLCAE